MAREIGTFQFPDNFEVEKQNPLDARLRCPLYSDMLGSTTTMPFPYLGMVVAVTDDPDESLNGVYVRVANGGVSESAPTDWKKIDGKITDFAVYEVGISEDPDTGDILYDEPVLRITESNGAADDDIWEVPLSDIGAAGYNAAGCHKFTIGQGDFTDIENLGSSDVTDIAILMDRSTSAFNGWPDQVNGVQQIIDSLNDAGYFDGTVKVSLITYASPQGENVELGLNGDYNTIITALNNIPNPSGSTHINDAIVKAYTQLTGVDSRDGANKLIVIVNDGNIGDFDTANVTCTDIKEGTYVGNGTDASMSVIGIGID